MRLRFIVAVVLAWRSLPAQAVDVAYPLRSGTRWVYHLRDEYAPGTHSSPRIEALMRGQVLDVDLEDRVAGSDRVGDAEYARVESTVNGQPHLVVWLRLAPDGLYMGKTYEPDGSDEHVMKPPQRVLSDSLQKGESWTWQQSEEQVTVRTHIWGPSRVNVPAGTFDATLVETELTAGKPAQGIRSSARRWFVPGTGFVKIELQTSVGGRRVEHMTQELKRFEPAG